MGGPSMGLREAGAVAEDLGDGVEGGFGADGEAEPVCWVEGVDFFGLVVVCAPVHGKPVAGADGGASARVDG